MKREPGPAVEIDIETGDRYMLRASVWCHEIQLEQCPVRVIVAATSVCNRYYARFASFLHEKDVDVLTRDYRGIGALRPDNLREFNAGWIIRGNGSFGSVVQDWRKRRWRIEGRIRRGKASRDIAGRPPGVGLKGGVASILALGHVVFS